MNDFKKYILQSVLFFFAVTVGAQTTPEGFDVEWYVTDFIQPVQIDFDETGRMYVVEKGGKIWLVEGGVKSTEPFIDLSDEVAYHGDHGMLGFVPDPNFYDNGYFYLYYVVDNYHLLNADSPTYDPTENAYNRSTIARVTRYQADANNNFATTIYDSRKVLIGETKETGVPMLHTSHAGGTVCFGDDGTLFVTTGDGSTWIAPYAGNGPPYEDEYVEQGLELNIITPAEEVGSYRSQLINNHNGKVLRIDPMTGDGISSNPYYEASNPRSPQSRLWARGLRNPFRAVVRPNSGTNNPDDGLPGTLYVADVGFEKWEEINIVKRPNMNFGWPAYEGMSFNNKYFEKVRENKQTPNNLSGGNCDQEFFTFQQLIKQPSIPEPIFYNPCDSSEVIPDEFTSIHDRPDLALGHHSTGGKYYIGTFDENGQASSIPIEHPDSPVEGNSQWRHGIATITGDFYTANTFPEELHGKLFIGDYSMGWIKTIGVDLNDNITSVSDWFSDTISISDIDINPVDGCLYFIDYPRGIKRICYGNNLLPKAIASADVFYGNSPLTVQFDGSESYDPKDDPITYFWDFGDGTTSTEISPIHTFTTDTNAPTPFTVQLTITDSIGASASTELIVSLNNTPPVVDITSIEDGTQYSLAGYSLFDLKATVTDAEHEGDELSYAWQNILGHNTHEHPDPFKNEVESTLRIEPFGCDGEIYYYRVVLEVEDAAGLKGRDEVFLYPDCSPIFVELLQFNASTNGEDVQTNWTTQSELNTDYFELQRALYNSGIFSTIGTILSKNVHNIETTYDYVDENPANGLNTYRLKIVSNNSAIVYSQEEDVYFASKEHINVYPNPANDQLTINFGSMQGNASILFYNAVGQRIGEYKWEGTGPVDQTIDTSSLSNGVYYYYIKNGDIESKGKVLIMH